MNWLHLSEAVFLGLAVGLMFWVLKKRDDQKKIRMWVLFTGSSLAIYLGLMVLGVSSELLAVKILLAVAIMITAKTVLQILTLLLWEYLATKQMEIPVPRLVMDVVNFLVMATLAVVLLNVLFGVKLTAFLVTSTVLSAVIGLSLQDILGNVFAGLSLQLERPYEMQDWIDVNGVEGAVEEMNWRVLTIRTRSNDLMAIPNSTVSKTIITNYSKPTKLHLCSITVGVSYSQPPEQVKLVLLQAVSDTHDINSKPAPVVFLSDFGSSSIQYEVRFWITNFSRKLHIENAVRSRIWYCLQRAGMSIPFPINDVYLHTISPDHENTIKEQLRREIVRELKKVDLFSPLSDSEIDTLSLHSSLLRYATDEPIVRQGDKGDSLYIIRSGMVEISVRHGRDEPVVLGTLGSGDCFGEMSILTGEPRTASVTAIAETQVVVVNKEGLKHVFASNPSAMKYLTELLEKRQKVIAASSEQASRKRANMSSGAKVKQRDDLLSRVKSFFKL